ncbi:MAG: FAD-dependent oxidoreductase [Synergistaceae bacterium]|nr:FAD-dependent oxidoreductase [Synergistaceae bacterium]
MSAKRIVVVGGGWGGVAAAAAARKAGAEVTLLERADMLLGTGLVGGIFRNNGRFTAAEEMACLGCGDMFEVMDLCSRHRNIEFPGHKHSSLYDVYEIEPSVKSRLLDMGIDVRITSSVRSVEKRDGRLASVHTSNGQTVEGDAFVDATGTSASPANCVKYGNGCAMCILRCHSFSPRVSITTLAGVEEWDAVKADGSAGAMSGSCKLFKESLSKEIASALERDGVAVIPIPEELRTGSDKLSAKACQQYATSAFSENIVLLDTGPAKLMTPYYQLEALRQITGFERARYEDPIAGGLGNSMRYFRFANCSNTTQAEGETTNIFCAGEKLGAMVGHTEAIVTGSLAGHNATRHAAGMPLLTLPDSLAVGDFVNHVIGEMKHPERRGTKYTFSGSVYFDRMKHLGLYTTDTGEIEERVRASGLSGVMKKTFS